MEPNRDEVGVRLDDGLQERVGLYAGREGLTVGEAMAALLYLGLEFAERQRAGLKEDIEDLQRELRDLKQMVDVRSEEHTSELQSLAYLVCRLLLEKKKKKIN